MWNESLSEDETPVDGTPFVTLPTRHPRIRELTGRQMECVLARNHVGRVGFQNDGRIEIVPVHYVYADGLLYGRTSRGSKYPAWRAQPDVVLEVDEIDDLFTWRSVIIRGKLSILNARGRPDQPFAYWNAVAAIRTLVPAAFTERDPVTHRSLVFRIAPSELTGREAVARAAR